MSRILSIGNSNTSAYRKLKQTPSDDETESSEEYTVFDKNDKSSIELQLVPGNRKRQRKNIHTNKKKHNCQLYLLLLAIVLVALSGLIVVIVLVRTLHDQPESRTNASFNDAVTPVYSEKENVIHSTHEQKLNWSTGETLNWNRSWEDVAGESCVRLLDVDGDGKDDILFGAADNKLVNAVVTATGEYGDLKDFCHRNGKQYPCMGYILALRGFDGQVLWNLTVRSEVFLMNCEDFDIDQDGKPDCIGTGRHGTAVAFNPYTGRQYWSVEDSHFLMGNWNMYQAVLLPDWNRDGVPEVLLANGGDTVIPAYDHDRQSGRLVVVCGKRGQPLGERYLEMPNSRETYMTPILYQPPTGGSIILFGSGGETISGNLMGISAIDLCHYIFGDEKAKDNCPEREIEKLWPNMERDEKGVFTIVEGTSKGVMVPPLIIDIDGDSVDDILVSVFDGKMVMKNGKDLSDIWSVSFSGMESYSTPAPGYFDDDSILDFMVHWCNGTWPWYSSSNVSVISGKDSSILWTLESTFYQMTSDLTLQTRDLHRDLFLFKQKGLKSPNDRNEKEKSLPRTDEELREKRHGEELPPLQPPNGVQVGTNKSLEGICDSGLYPQVVDEACNSNNCEGTCSSRMIGTVSVFICCIEEQMIRKYSKKYRKYHITCDEDLSRHRGEMFLMDRSTMTNPLKVLDIPLQKYYYDDPFMDPSTQTKVYHQQPDENHSMTDSHNGVPSQSEPSPRDESLMTNGSLVTDGFENHPKVIRRCLMLSSDDRSTGAIGDLNGDGVLEYITIYSVSGHLLDAMYRSYGKKMNLHVSVISLNLNSSHFTYTPVPSESSFQPKQPLKNIRDVHLLPYRDQKWTQYMGKHGNSNYEH